MVQLEVNKALQVLVTLYRTKNMKCCLCSMKHVGIKDSNEAEVLTILEELKTCSSLNNQGLVVLEESDSSNMDNFKKGSFPFSI